MSDSVAVLPPLLASVWPWIPRTVAPCPQCVCLSGTLPGTRLLHRASAPGADPSTRLRRLLTPLLPGDSPRSTSQIFSSSGFGWITMPYGLPQRFRSTAFLCRLRATKTLLR